MSRRTALFRIHLDSATSVVRLSLRQLASPLRLNREPGGLAVFNRSGSGQPLSSTRLHRRRRHGSLVVALTWHHLPEISPMVKMNALSIIRRRRDCCEAETSSPCTPIQLLALRSIDSIVDSCPGARSGNPQVTIHQHRPISPWLSSSMAPEHRHTRPSFTPIAQRNLPRALRRAEISPLGS